jgi:cysteine desulfurase family protein
MKIEPHNVVYLDHGATSFPKAPGVAKAVSDFLLNVGASPGRSSHSLSLTAGRIVFKTRSSIAKLFSAPSSQNVIFTNNVTEAINMVLFSLLRNNEENHVVTTESEHNALIRPLNYLVKEWGLKVTRIPTSAGGQINPEDITRALTKDTKLVALFHGSNVTGIVRPLEAICKARKNVPLLIDGAQTGGIVPVSLSETPVDYFCFTGHKGLLGPQGTGGVILGKDCQISPLIFGGTGSNSEEEFQPDFLPDMLESGTPNMPGIAGLGCAADYLISEGVANLYEKEVATRRYMMELLRKVDGLSLVGADDKLNHLPTISLVFDNCSVSEAAYRLDRESHVAVRVGLHCAPSSHKRLHTFPEGTLRLSAGPFLTRQEIAYAIESIARISKGSN